MELVLNTFGASLNRDNDGFVISTSDGKQRIPSEGVTSIRICKSAQITSDAVLLAIEREIEILFVNKAGDVFGRIWSPKYGSISTIRKGQLNFSMDREALVWIKEILQRKIENQQALLLMMHTDDDVTRNKVQTAIRRLDDYRTKIGSAEGEIVNDAAASS